jgi:MerR family transcriptional regulator, repressor of the yfmOP operon
MNMGRGEDMSSYKIEDVAKECGLTKRTIRYYEQIGLLSPPKRSEGGFRLYTDKHVERLKQIINARDVLGISLQELQEFVSISEEFNNHRQEIRQTEDKEVKLTKITEIEYTIGKQLTMIDQKLEKLSEIRKEFGQLYERVLEAKTRIKSGQE